MSDEGHKEICNCSFCKNERRKSLEIKKQEKDGVSAAPPHHFHTEYKIEAGPGDEDFEPDHSEPSKKPQNEYRSFDRHVILTMKSQRKIISSRGPKPSTSPTEAYERMIGKG
jgi:hypothetical protein